MLLLLLTNLHLKLFRTQRIATDKLLITQRVKNKLQIVQNKVIRFILDLPARSHVGYDEFSKANMFPVDLRVDQLKMNHLFNIIHGIH